MCPHAQTCAMRRKEDHPRLDALGSRLRSQRLQRHWTQEALAEAAGTKPETVSRVENGAVYPDLLTLAKLCDALECTFGEVLDASGAAPMMSEEEGAVYQAVRRLSRPRQAALVRLLDDQE